MRGINEVEAAQEELRHEIGARVPQIRWDLIRLTDPKRHGDGSWQRDRESLTGSGTIRIPLIPQGSYKLRVHFTRHKAEFSGGTRLYLPMGKHAVPLVIGPEGHDYSAIEAYGQTLANSSRHIEEGQEYQLDVVVRHGAAQTEIVIHLDQEEKPLMSWRGPRSALRSTALLTLSGPQSFALHQHSHTNLIIHSAHAQMLDGLVKLVDDPL